MAFGKGGGFDDFGGFGYGGPPAYAGGFAPSYAAPQSGYAGRFGGKGFGGKGVLRLFGTKRSLFAQGPLCQAWWGSTEII